MCRGTMPIYEYRCGDCRKRSSLFFRSFSLIGPAICTHCGGGKMHRLVSRVALMKSEDARLESLESGLGSMDESDPASVARWARSMGDEMGEEMGPEIDEIVDQMASGEAPIEGGPADSGGPMEEL